jgi:hypothetical protein
MGIQIIALAACRRPAGHDGADRLGLLVDGTVTCLGLNDELEAQPPLDLHAIEISCGTRYSCATDANCELVCWARSPCGISTSRSLGAHRSQSCKKSRRASRRPE